MKKKNYSEKVISIICLAILTVYFVAIIHINFSKNPFYYNTDMYSDMIFAAEAWEHKSLFPEGWVFGNQLYIISTPALAAIIYGLLGDLCISMGLASTVLGLGIVLSFDWMLRAFTEKLHERLICITSFMTIVLLSGDLFLSTNGFQLFFTMCSYYACYLITAFLVFGCFLREIAGYPVNKIIFFISLIFSFACGIQSVRQTLVMTLPLVALIFIHAIHLYSRKEKVFNKVCRPVSLCAANLMGLVFASFLDIEQTQLFGAIHFNSISEIFPELAPAVKNAMTLLFPLDYSPMRLTCCVLGVLSLYFTVKFLKKRNFAELACLLLFLFSLAFTFLVDITTDMAVRSIYYFMLYPTLALFVLFVCRSFGGLPSYIAAAALAVISLNVWKAELAPWLLNPYKNDTLLEVNEYLSEKGINTIYASWNQGERIAISSDFKFDVGFWTSPADPFIGVYYICNPQVYDAPPEESAYLFFSKEEFEAAGNNAEKIEAQLKLLKYFDASGIYVCQSPDDIIGLYGKYKENAQE